jgi:hypothetical protein
VQQLVSKAERVGGQPGLVGLYWGARQEPIEPCARRVYESLRALKVLGYERYFLRGRSRRDAMKRELNLTPEAVLATLAKGVNHTDVPRRPIPELGWSLGLWSGGPDDECYGIDFRCGASSDYAGNSVVMSLPLAGPLRIGAAPERALKAYDALVQTWNPDQAVLCEGPIRWDEDHRLVAECPPLAQHRAGGTAQ